MGSGANIVVLSGDHGKFLVDAGISVSEAEVKSALNAISPTPVVYVVNTHWHWDHTDGNGWMHQSGAKIIARPKHTEALVTGNSCRRLELDHAPGTGWCAPHRYRR